MMNKLIGTPRRSGDQRLEFTPIGKSRSRPPPDPVSNTTRNHDVRVVNTSVLDSDFDDTDHLNTSFVPLQSRELNVERKGLSFKSRFGQIADGLNSIKETQNELQRLQTENYNLKVEVATLKKHFMLTPAEQRQVIDQNIELKQRLATMLNQVRDLKLQLSQVDGSDKENLASVQALRSQYQEVIKEKDAQLDRLEQQLQAAHHSLLSVNDLLLEEVERLRADNQSLRRQANVKLTLDSELGSRLNQANEQIVGLEKQVAQYKRDNDEVSARNADLGRQVEKLQRQLSLMEVKGDSSSRVLQDQLRQSHADLEALERELSKWREKYTALNAEYEKALSARSASLGSAKAEYEQRLDAKDGEIHRLNRVLKNLQGEVLEKEREEAALRLQLRAAMESRANRSADELYEKQIEALKSKESRLQNEIRQLKDELAENEDRLYQANTDASRYHGLQKEVTELRDRVRFYEKEYEGAGHTIKALEAEVVELRSRLERKQASFREAPDFDKHKYIEEIDELKFENRRLQRQLDFEKAGEPSNDLELHKLMNDKKVLQMSVDEYEIQTSELKLKVSKIQKVVSEKEQLIESLEARVRDLNRQLTLGLLANDDVIKKSYEQRLADVHDDYKQRIRDMDNDYKRLEAEYRAQLHRFRDTAPADLSPLTTLLETQLSHARLLNDELQRKLSDLLANETRTSSQINEMKVKLEESQERSAKLARDKSKLDEVVSSLQLQLSMAELENTRLELKTKNLAAELNDAFQNCTKLLQKLLKLDLDLDLAQAKRNNAAISKHIEQLDQKYTVAKMSPPASPSKRGELKLARLQLQYYKALLHDFDVKARDLEFMNGYMMKAIKSSNQSLKNDLMKLASCGIYPDYTSMSLARLRNGGTISLRVVAQFVLAMVRVRRRSQRARLRKEKLTELKSEIDTEKIVLLS